MLMKNFISYLSLSIRHYKGVFHNVFRMSNAAQNKHIWLLTIIMYKMSK